MIETDATIVKELVSEDTAIGSPYFNFDCFYTKYRWEGGKVAYCSLRWLPADLDKGLTVGARFWLGDLHLVIVDFNTDALCIRVSQVSRFAWVTIVKTWIHRQSRTLYYRLIRTAEIWGLATIDPACYPSWNDLHIVRWFHKLTKKGKA